VGSVSLSWLRENADSIQLSGTRHLQEIADAGLELPAVNQIELHPFCQQKEIVKWCSENGIIIEVNHFFHHPGSDLLRFWEYPLIFSHGRRIALFFVENGGTTLLWWACRRNTEKESNMYSFAGVSRKSTSISTLLTLCPTLIWHSRYSPLPKSSQPDRVKSNADVYDFSLNDEDMKALDALDEGDNGALMWNPIHAP